MTIERRHSPRIETGIQTQILHRGRCFSTRVINLSREGLFLQTDALTIPSGMFIDISLTLDDHHWQMSGLVIWSCPKGVGVVFRVSQPELYDMVLAREPGVTTELRRTMATQPPIAIAS
jgi:Tfp pilus assembly protein PilZ